MTTGLVDTSVIIDWHEPAVVDAVPGELGVSTITLAELATGPLLARDAADRARRQARLQLAEAIFEPIDFDRAAGRSYGQVVAAMSAYGRSHRGRIADLFIAATAHSRGSPLYTRNAGDFVGLEQLIEVVAI